MAVINKKNDNSTTEYFLFFHLLKLNALQKCTSNICKYFVMWLHKPKQLNWGYWLTHRTANVTTFKELVCERKEVSLSPAVLKFNAHQKYDTMKEEKILRSHKKFLL